MDLGAYTQIENLSEIASKNGIVVPRLRGYRLMKDQERFTEEDIVKASKALGIQDCQWLLCEIGRGGAYEFSPRTDRLVDKYLIKGKVKSCFGDEYEDYVGINWDAVHGKLRKEFKFTIKNAEKRQRKQYEVFNKYVGRDDVLYIHARIGGSNWNYYDGPDLERQPWFLEKVDEAFDGTYCDIYAKIKPIKTEEEDSGA